MAFISVDLMVLFQWIYTFCFGDSVAFLGELMIPTKD